MSAEATASMLMFAGYLVAGLSHAAYLYDSDWRRTAAWTARAVLALHTVALWSHLAGRPRPFLSLYDTTLLLSWASLSAYLVADLRWSLRGIGALLMPALLGLLAASAGAPAGGGPAVAVTGGPRLLWHVGPTVLSYALFGLAALGSVAYLALESQLKRRDFRRLFFRLPSLETLDRLGRQLVSLAFPLLSVGIATGLYWATEAWPGNFYADPKLIFTGLTWLVYGGYLALRARGWRGRRAAWLNCSAFALVLVNYFVINLFFTEWHGL